MPMNMATYHSDLSCETHMPSSCSLHANHASPHYSLTLHVTHIQHAQHLSFLNHPGIVCMPPSHMPTRLQLYHTTHHMHPNHRPSRRSPRPSQPHANHIPTESHTPPGYHSSLSTCQPQSSMYFLGATPVCPNHRPTHAIHTLSRPSSTPQNPLHTIHTQTTCHLHVPSAPSHACHWHHQAPSVPPR